MHRCELTDIDFSCGDLYSQHRLAIADNLTNSYSTTLYEDMIEQLAAIKIMPKDFFENLDLSIINRYSRCRVHITYALETELRQTFDIKKIEFIKASSVDGAASINVQIKVSFERKSSYLFLQKQYNVIAFSYFPLIQKESISDGDEVLTLKMDVEKYAFAALIYTANNLNTESLHARLLEYLNHWWPRLQWEMFLTLHTDVYQTSHKNLEEIIMFITRADVNDLSLELPNLD